MPSVLCTCVFFLSPRPTNGVVNATMIYDLRRRKRRLLSACCGRREKILMTRRQLQDPVVSAEYYHDRLPLPTPSLNVRIFSGTGFIRFTFAGRNNTFDYYIARCRMVAHTNLSCDLCSSKPVFRNYCRSDEFIVSLDSLFILFTGLLRM